MVFPLARDAHSDAMLASILPNPPAAVVLIAHEPMRAALGAAWPTPLDGPAREDLCEDPRLVPLSRGEDEGHQLPPLRLAGGLWYCTHPGSGPRLQTLGFFVCPSRMLTGSDHRAIDKKQVPVQLTMGVGLCLHCREEPLPDACPPPAAEATGHGAPWTISFRQIAPGRPSAQNPQDAIDDRAMVMGGSPSLRFLGWEQGWERLPLDVGQFASVHVASPPFQLSFKRQRDETLGADSQVVAPLKRLS